MSWMRPSPAPLRVSTASASNDRMLVRLSPSPRAVSSAASQKIGDTIAIGVVGCPSRTIAMKEWTELRNVRSLRSPSAWTLMPSSNAISDAA